MSWHRDTTFCGHRDLPDGRRQTHWVGACDCGWIGAEHASGGSEGADAAKREYREHVESALGAAAYYDSDVACKNCGSQHRQGVLVGTHVTSATCARCGTRMLSPDNEAWHAADRHSRDWFR